jgi:hypothetical protein
MVGAGLFMIVESPAKWRFGAFSPGDFVLFLGKLLPPFGV